MTGLKVGEYYWGVKVASWQGKPWNCSIRYGKIIQIDPVKYNKTWRGYVRLKYDEETYGGEEIDHIVNQNLLYKSKLQALFIQASVFHSWTFIEDEQRDYKLDLNYVNEKSRKYNPFLEVVSFKGDQVFKVTHKHLI